MTVWKVLLAVFLVLFLLGMIRVGGAVEYSAGELFAQLRVGPLKFQIFPLKKETEKEKERKKAKKRRKTAENDGKTPGKNGGKVAQKIKVTPDLVKNLLSLAVEAAGGLKRRLRIDKLFFYYTASAADAAGTATSFGYVNAAIGTFFPLIQQNFELKEYHVRTTMDFTLKSPAIYLDLAISGRVGQLLFFFLRLGVKFLSIWFSRKKVAQPVKTAQKAA